MKASSEIRDYQTMIALFSSAVLENAADHAVYNMAMTAQSKIDIKEVLGIFQQMQTRGIRPSTFSYKLAIEAAEETEQWEEAFRYPQTPLRCGCRAKVLSIFLLLLCRRLYDLQAEDRQMDLRKHNDPILNKDDTVQRMLRRSP